MRFVRPGADYDVFLLVLSIMMLVVFTFLAATLVYTFLKRDQQKPGYYIFYVVVGLAAIYQCVQLFYAYTWLGMAAVLIYISFGLIIFLALRKNKG